MAAYIDESRAIASTRRWVESVVVELGLCPFAAEVLRGERVRMAVSAAPDAASLLEDLDAEVDRLLRASVGDLDTTLLIHPRALLDFEAYNAFLDPAEALLRARGCEGVLQLASFHPAYRFAGAADDDAANYTNRSPHPMLHLLREESVSRAVAAHPDPEAIPSANIARLRSLGSAAMARRLARCER